MPYDVESAGFYHGLCLREKTVYHIAQIAAEHTFHILPEAVGRAVRVGVFAVLRRHEMHAAYDIFEPVAFYFRRRWSPLRAEVIDLHSGVQADNAGIFIAQAHDFRHIGIHVGSGHIAWRRYRDRAVRRESVMRQSGGNCALHHGFHVGMPVAELRVAM